MKTAYALIGLLVIAIIVGVFLVGSEREAGEFATTTMLSISSTAFTHNTPIPSQYTCDGENKNPRLEILGVPEGAASLALIMDDPDIPDVVKQSRGIEKFDHWVVFNLPTATSVLEEGSTPEGVEGVNSAGTRGYTGPCPPDGEHRYFFKLFALDTELSLAEGATKQQVEEAMEGHIIEQAELIGLYTRK